MNQDYSNLVDAELIEADIMDPRWETSPFFKLKCMKPKQAGSRYEKIVESIFTKMGTNVEPPLNTDHDRIVDDEKIEIKGSMITKGTDDEFSFLQIRPKQEYDTVVFLAIYFQEMHLYEMSKADVEKKIKEGVFKPQHGGKKGDSGTFCYNGTMEALGATPIEFE